jgi:hypothetical protein
MTAFFLSGEVQTDWRKEIKTKYPTLLFFDPKVKPYNAKAKQRQRKALQETPLVLVLLKGAGKGTKFEIRYCEKAKKPCETFPDIDTLLAYLEENLEELEKLWT